jgi:hypothetical protein
MHFIEPKCTLKRLLDQAGTETTARLSAKGEPAAKGPE